MEIVECSVYEWDDFVDTSLQGTIFCKSYVLNSYNQDVKHLLCREGNNTFGGFACVTMHDEIKQMPFNTYCGILYSDLRKHLPYRQNRIKFDVAHHFASFLFNKYTQLTLLNHWDVIDLRPFSWFNYHEKEKGYYEIDVCYTSLLNLAGIPGKSIFSKSREYSLKKSYQFNQSTAISRDLSILNELHEKTFQRQSLERSAVEEQALINLCNSLMANNAGALFVTEVEGQPASASFFAMDKFRAYYLFGATDPQFRSHETGTRNIVDAFLRLKDAHKITVVDLVGVNSPQRGWYKLSFGGEVIPYYKIRKISPCQNGELSGEEYV